MIHWGGNQLNTKNYSPATTDFINRVLGDSGKIETPRCIDEKLIIKYYSDRTQAFVDRVVSDSGKYEDAECVDEKLQLT